MKVKESEKLEVKKLWNMKETVTPVIVRNLGAISKNLEKGIKELEIRPRIQFVQNTAL